VDNTPVHVVVGAGLCSLQEVLYARLQVARHKVNYLLIDLLWLEDVIVNERFIQAFLSIGLVKRISR
jgi:hypothetical protein